MKNQKSLIKRCVSTLLVLTLILPILPTNPAFAAALISDPQAGNIEYIWDKGIGKPAEIIVPSEPEYKRIADALNPVPAGDDRLAGIWTVYVDGIPRGYDMPVKYVWYQKINKGYKQRAEFYNFIALSKANDWINALLNNGKYNIEPADVQQARTRASKMAVTIKGYRDNSKKQVFLNEKRIYIRRFAEICGTYVEKYVPDRYNWGKTGKVYVITYPAPTGQIAVPPGNLYDDTEIEFAITARSYAAFSPETMKALGLNYTQYTKVSFYIIDKNNNVLKLLDGYSVNSNQYSARIPKQLAAGQYTLKLFVKDIVGRWVEYKQQIYVNPRIPDTVQEGAEKIDQDGLKARFIVDIYNNGRLIVSGEDPRPKLNDLLQQQKYWLNKKDDIEDDLDYWRDELEEEEREAKKIKKEISELKSKGHLNRRDRERLEDLEDSLRYIEKRIKKYEDKIDKLEKELDAVNSELSVIQNKIQQTSNEVNKWLQLHDKAMVGDTIVAINKSIDTSWMYTKVYDVLKTAYYTVAGPPHENETRSVDYHDQVRENKEYARMNTPKWYLPTVYSSKVPYAQAQQISFNTKNITQSYSDRTYYYSIYPYHYVDHGKDITRKTSRWKSKPIKDDNGNVIGKKWYIDRGTLTVHDYDTRWEKYNNSQYVRYGRIEPGKYVSKRFSDDKWQMESYPVYTLWIAMTITDYYTKTPTPYIETNFSYYYAPVKVYFNNKPVAYFTVLGNVSAVGDKIRIVDYSYDPDDDKITDRIWEIDGKTFTSVTALENYINNTLVNKPGTYTITLKVKDDPTLRYPRLTPRWSEEFKKKITIYPKNSPTYLSYKAEIDFDREYVYTMWHKNAELNARVKVYDIGYWTWDTTALGSELRFRPVKVTKVLEPYHNIVRYTDSKDIMKVAPESFDMVSTSDNSFIYEVKFRYPKAGRPESQLVIPFETEWFGYIDTLRVNVPVNAFNPTFFDDPTVPDKTKFYKIQNMHTVIDHQVTPPKP